MLYVGYNFNAGDQGISFPESDLTLSSFPMYKPGDVFILTEDSDGKPVFVKVHDKLI